MRDCRTLILSPMVVLFALTLGGGAGAQQQQCPPDQHWDDGLEECLPNDPTQCPGDQYWDSDMKMCMPKRQVMMHLNQFVVFTDGSGPRGRTALSGPNMWMISATQWLSAKNQVEVSWMGTTDLWTVPKNGTPELLQTGESNNDGVPFIDAQHPHSSPIMGLTFSDIIALGKSGQHKLTLFFAPRGEATAGPEAFMHRDSAEGNPDAPLAHHLQDVFHITSTVLGAKLVLKSKTTLEASVFSGQEPAPSKVNLDVHTPDSFGMRVNQNISEHLNAGASFAQIKSSHPGDTSGKQDRERAISAWITTKNEIGKGALYTSFIFGQVKNVDDEITLNSFLEELVYQLGKNRFFGRLEILQRTPEQLEIKIVDDPNQPKWVKAVTLGYERNFLSKNDLNLYGGASVTGNSVPDAFQPAYGSNPRSGRIFLRINWSKGHHHR